MHFKIIPLFETEVQHIRKESNNRWKVSTTQGDIVAQHVVIATGANRIPVKPKWEGMDNYTGQISHSLNYKNPDRFRGSRVLVIGMGNTGAEIALDLADANIPVWISLRGTVNIVPRDLNGRPVQETSKLLAKLPFGLGDWVGAKVQRWYFGDLSKYGLNQSKMYPAVELRVTGKTPMIDVGTVKAIKDGKIQVVPGVRRFIAGGVELENGQHLKCEHVILATGYRPQLQTMVESVEPFLDKNGFPKSPVGDGDLEGLFFVGFDNYKLGGILGTINTDSEVVAKALNGSK
jgi:lysine/ornithine N-monooxygenase